MKSGGQFQLLSFNAGFVDTTGFLGLQGLFLAHITGNFVTLAATLVMGTHGVLAKVLVLPEFILVLALGRLGVSRMKARGRPILRVALAAMMCAMLAFFVLAVVYGPFPDSDAPAALVTAFAGLTAMAMQNAVQRVHFASMPPTTLMTGNITQAVIDAGDLIWKFEPIDAAAVRARLVRTLRGIISFAAGCALAALLYYWFGFWCLAVPVAVGALTAILTEHVPADATTIRLCRDDERNEILSIINAAAEAYRGVIPADRWHEPYMPGDALDRERAAGVVFWGYQDRGRLAGVMGLQDVGDVNLIRHAYVLPAQQRAGIGGRLLKHLQQMSTKPMLVGTWAAASWAIRFYERHGFALVSPHRKTALLKSYWTIPERQIETSVVLANPPDVG